MKVDRVLLNQVEGSVHTECKCRIMLFGAMFSWNDSCTTGNHGFYDMSEYFSLVPSCLIQLCLSDFQNWWRVDNTGAIQSNGIVSYSTVPLQRGQFSWKSSHKTSHNVMMIMLYVTFRKVDCQDAGIYRWNLYSTEMLDVWISWQYQFYSEKVIERSFISTTAKIPRTL